MTPPDAGRPPRLGVHVCTRDGAERMAVLLGDLAVVLDGFDAKVIVYDDSTTSRHRASCRDACSFAELDTQYFGEPDRRALVARAGSTMELEADLLGASRPFGSGGWDLAGCRFTAMLNAAMHPDPATLHLFVDDDLRLVDADYANRPYTIDTEGVRGLLGGSGLPTERLFAAGAGFRGRADLALLEHLDAALRDSWRVEKLGDDGRLSACISSGEDHHPDSPGISGGFLLTNRRSLRAVPLSPSYNEDWIWLRQLTMAGGTITRAGSAVLHAGSPRVALSLGVLRRQFEGEVLDTSVRLCAAAALPFDVAATYVHEAFGVCVRKVDATLVRARALGTRSVCDLLRRFRAEVDRVPPAHFADLLVRQADRSRRWARAFAALTELEADDRLAARSPHRVEPFLHEPVDDAHEVRRRRAAQTVGGVGLHRARPPAPGMLDRAP
ncbi:MAG: hypothetical protein M3203_06035 [Actinomycetota bacterium]|nr:hypothetical protein [Actinomycetota bacterium]